MTREIKNVSYDYSGHTVLITGGGRGQGRAHALNFAEAGADIIICEPDHQFDTVPYALAGPDELNSTAAEVEALGVKCMPAVCDVSDAVQVKTMVDDAIAEFGKIDILISNGAIDSLASVVDMDEAYWDQMIDVNLKGSFLCSKYVAPGMIERGRGKILVTGSVNSHVGSIKQAHYVSSKHGLLGFVRSLAIELAPHGITVNLVCPGSTDTRMVSGLLESKDGEWLEQLGDLTGPWNLIEDGKMLEPAEITRAMMWLASDAADFVTGTSLTVDAGFTVK